ncbi:MAG: alpha-N-arabinofuranosidase, partial [Treponema sp.]|jgi:alpha-N-arabinofuranosidase|nr:alpha-N-arabinofuranosidase [Treponema sp.]
VKNEQEVKVELRGMTLSPSVTVRGQILSAETMTAHNTFDKPDTVTLKNFSGVTVDGARLALMLPPMSVVTVELA